MKTSAQYLDALKAHFRVESDYALARALYAASQYGRGDRLAWSLEGRRLAAELQAAQAREIEQLRQQLARLVRLADFGAANAPLWRMVRA